jgi:hypothetical protein
LVFNGRDPPYPANVNPTPRGVVNGKLKKRKGDQDFHEIIRILTERVEQEA